MNPLFKYIFLKTGESSGDRAAAALVSIGPAIFNGGTTTVLALVFLAFSSAYPFVVMFR